eukprot:s4920_g1.t1
MAVPLSKSELDFAIQALRVRLDVILAGQGKLWKKDEVWVDVLMNWPMDFLGNVCGWLMDALGNDEVFVDTIMVGPWVHLGKLETTSYCWRISFHVEFGPLASPSFEVGRPSPQATSVGNFVERLLRGSRAIDAEALCIVGGQKDDGNLNDVCAIAALCALLHFRKADVEVQGDKARSFAKEERAPVPLSVHHLPVPVSFALFPGAAGKESEPAWILDPNRLEEAAMGGCLCIAVNQHGELCGLHKPGGLPLDFSMIQHCMELAVTKAKEITNRINSELEADLAKRKQAQRNVHQLFNEVNLLTVDWSATTSKEATVPSAPAPLPPRLVLPEVRPEQPPSEEPPAPEPSPPPEASKEAPAPAEAPPAEQVVPKPRTSRKRAKPAAASEAAAAPPPAVQAAAMDLLEAL